MANGCSFPMKTAACPRAKFWTVLPIHKAVGWMLREVGKKEINVLRTYLEAHCHEMARTTLRYAIERMDAGERREWLKR